MNGRMDDTLDLQRYVQLMCAYVIVIHLDICSVRFERIGCFNDKRDSSRLLPSYLLNDIDEQLQSFSGQLIDWENWYEHLPDFACRCAKRALEKGWRLFGIQFWGEIYIQQVLRLQKIDIFLFHDQKSLAGVDWPIITPTLVSDLVVLT